MALPVVTFDVTKAVVGRQGIISFTPTGGTVTNLLVDFVGHTPGLQIGNYQAPSSTNGPAYTAQTWIKSRAELFKFKSKEVKKIVTMLGSLSDLKSGTCILYIRDPNDAALAVALMSDSFACALYPDTTEVQFTGANPAELNLVIESHKDGPVTLTPDGTP